MNKRHKGNLRRFVYKRDRGLCQICGCAVAPEEMTMDHILPKSLGGGTTRENLRLACFECNNRLGDGRPEGFHRRRMTAGIKRRAARDRARTAKRAASGEGPVQQASQNTREGVARMTAKWPADQGEP